MSLYNIRSKDLLNFCTTYIQLPILCFFSSKTYKYVLSKSWYADKQVFSEKKLRMYTLWDEGQKLNVFVRHI